MRSPPPGAAPQPEEVLPDSTTSSREPAADTPLPEDTPASAGADAAPMMDESPLEGDGHRGAGPLDGGKSLQLAQTHAS
jgi:hypothetical protein